MKTSSRRLLVSDRGILINLALDHKVFHLQLDIEKKEGREGGSVGTHIILSRHQLSHVYTIAMIKEPKCLASKYLDYGPLEHTMKYIVWPSGP